MHKTKLFILFPIDETPEPMEVETESQGSLTPSTQGSNRKGRGRPKRDAPLKSEEVKTEVKPENEEVKQEVKEEVKEEVIEAEDVADILKPKTRNRSGSR